MQNHDFVIAGYVATASEWQKLDGPWNEALRHAGLSEFKMRDCEMGQGEFRSRRDRPELQALFIALIRSIDATGYAVRVDLQAYVAARKAIGAKLKQGYFPAYLQAFAIELQFITSVSKSAPLGERIAFVFDQQDEFSGRAMQIYGTMKRLPDVAYRDRLGPISFDDSKGLPPLQAADMLAYEIHRQFKDGNPPPEKERWQGIRLSEGGKVNLAFLDENKIKEWVAAWSGG